MARRRNIPLPRQTAAAAVIAARDEWRATLFRDYANTSRRLTAVYERSLIPIRANATRLMSEYRALYEQSGGQISYEDVRGLRGYADLLARVEGELAEFARIGSGLGTPIYEQAVTQGIAGAGAMTAAQDTGTGVIRAAWIQPNAGAMRNAAVYVDESGFQKVWQDFAPNAAQNLGDTLLTMMAQGKSPLATARYLNAWWGVPLSWANNTARTLQLYSYRAGALFAYQQNKHLLRGWIWSSSRDVRTCVSCLSQDGQEFTLDELLRDHHQGRCAMLPVVKGASWPQEYGTGPEWFDAQPEDMQRALMGRGLFEAYSAGNVAWADLRKPYQNAIYGTMYRAPTLTELGLRKRPAPRPLRATPAPARPAQQAAGGEMPPFDPSNVRLGWHDAVRAQREANPNLTVEAAMNMADFYYDQHEAAWRRGDIEAVRRHEAFMRHLARPPVAGETRNGVTYRNTGFDRNDFVSNLRNLGFSEDEANAMTSASWDFTGSAYSFMRETQMVQRGSLVPKALRTAAYLEESERERYFTLGERATTFVEAQRNNRYAGSIRRGLSLNHNGNPNAENVGYNVENGYWYERGTSSYSYNRRYAGGFLTADTVVDVLNVQSQGVLVEGNSHFSGEMEVLTSADTRFRIIRAVRVIDLPDDDPRRSAYWRAPNTLIVEVVDESNFDERGLRTLNEGLSNE
jgi:hypothetical protein